MIVGGNIRGIWSQHGVVMSGVFLYGVGEDIIIGMLQRKIGWHDGDGNIRGIWTDRSFNRSGAFLDGVGAARNSV